MSNTIDSVKSRIAKLLNLADNSSAAEGEVRNAVAAAQRLMLQHHIEEDDIRQAMAQKQESDTDAWTMSRTTCYSHTANRCAWEEDLMDCVMRLVGSTKWYFNTKVPMKNAFGTKVLDPKTGRYIRRVRYTIYGHTEDIEVAVELFNVLQQTIITMSLAKCGGTALGKGFEYCLGFVYGINEQIRKQKALTLEGTTETKALAVRSSAICKRKKNEAERWLKEDIGMKITMDSSSLGQCALNKGTFSTGKQDGLNCDISKPTPTKKLC